MTWEIWKLSTPDPSAKILEILPFGDDESAARAKFSEIEERTKVTGGTYELRKNGQYVFRFSVTLPEAKD